MEEKNEKIIAHPIDWGANYTEYRTEYNGYPIYFRDYKETGKRKFKINEDLIKSGYVKVPENFDINVYNNKWIEL